MTLSQTVIAHDAAMQQSDSLPVPQHLLLVPSGHYTTNVGRTAHSGVCCASLLVWRLQEGNAAVEYAVEL